MSDQDSKMIEPCFVKETCPKGQVIEGRGVLGQLGLEVDKAHRNGSDTAHNLSFGGVLEAANFLLGLGMRDSGQLVAIQLAPTANIRVAKLDEVNRAFELGPPRDRLYFVLT
jgi:hypothetical protein